MPPHLIQPISLRILSRLRSAKKLEPDAWVRDDLDIAYLTVLYAATGEAVRCSPHVLASYKILGLHPEKVWPAIVARRKALGLEEVWGAPDCPVPKKPVQSASLWPFNANRASAVNACPGYNRTMDSTAAAYPIPAVRGSANLRQYFDRNTLTSLFFSLPCKPRLRYSAYKVWQVSTAPQGKEIRCFKTVKQYAKAVGVCERTMRYHLRQLERLFGACGVHSDGADPFCERCRAVALFQLDRRANTIRKPSTHRLNLDQLQHPRRDDGRCPVCLHVHLGQEECGCELQSRHSYKRHCRCQVSQHQAEVTEMPSRKPAQPAPPLNPDPPLKAAPEAPKRVAEVEPVQTELTDRQRSRLRRRTQAIMRDWSRNAEAHVGSGSGGLLFIDIVRRACDDEFIEFDLAWPWLQKLWWRNDHGWRKASRLDES